MRRFLSVIGAASAIVLALVLLLEGAFRNQKNRIDVLFDRIEASRDVVDLVLIGNSHVGALGDLDLHGKYKSLNLVVGGQDLFHAAAIMRYVVGRMPRLKVIIIGVDYHLLGYDLKGSNQDFLDRQYYPYIDSLYDNGFSNRLMAKSRFLRSNRDFRQLFAPPARQAVGEPSSADVVPVSDGKLTRDGCRKRAAEHTKIGFDDRLMSKNASLLREMAESGKRARVSVLFVTLPKTRCYREFADGGNIPGARKLLYDVLRPEEGRHVLYLDYYEDQRFVDGDFKDYDHMNEAGRAKFQKVLQADLERLDTHQRPERD
ncbi:MAG: hypothetical protein HY924_15645 [Elusimicrobia bacterium]|nr:hypothetical protein [Elusimicrobiota bacterium]